MQPRGSVLVLLVLLIEGISAQDDVTEKCCKLGTSWANQKYSCDKFKAPVAGISKDDESSCLETVDICCRKAFRQKDCELGKSDAKSGLACTRSETGKRKAPIGPGDVRHDCCEGCKLGIQSGSSSKSCEKKASFGDPWDPAFAECCEEKLATRTARAASTKGTTEEDEPEDAELNGIFKEITDPTFAAAGDLCQLMRGLLCSDVCVPTPGSYYCECREGSTLQADGRSCESPSASTTKAATRTTAKKASPKTATTKATPETATGAAPTTTSQSQRKTTRSPANKATRAPPKTTKNRKKGAEPSSPSTTPKSLASRAKVRTTRSLTTDDNELNQSCPSGFRLNPTSNTCDDVDECIEQRQPCPPDSQCRNNNGSYDCASNCEFGYRWNSSIDGCVDVDECLESAHKCIAETENCKNLEGSYECEIKCDPGYIFNGFYAACLDVNECSDLANPCPQLDTICVNTLGSYECKSFADYQTSSSNDSSFGPTARNGNDYGDVGITDEGRDTICAYGFTYNSELKSCDDVDECEILAQPCGQGEICRNTPGGYDCVPAGCHRGFVLVNESCVDVDECEESLHSCLENEVCRNTNGSFTCEPPRPTPRPSTSERPPIVCRKGYKADYGLDGCVDIDECVEGPGCRDHERCINYQGTYDCSPLCGQGWYFHMESKTCQDVDECMLGHHNCRQRTQYCRNTNGSYICEPLEICGSGYRRAHNGSCIDVDECQEGLHSCSRESHRYCINNDGGYECITRLPSCSPGFEYSLLTHDCEDVDECRTGKANCDPRLNERCINLPGTYKCERTVPQVRRVRPACPNGTRYDVKLRMCAGKPPTTTVATKK